MIEPSRAPQPSFAEGLIQEEVGPLWEEWMREVDVLLADPQLVQIVYEALPRRWPKSRTRGRPGTPAEIVLRLLLLKHLRNWSYAVLEREVRANLVYRQFTRVGGGKVPDAKTLGRLAVALGPQIIEQLHRRVVAIACEKRIVRGRRLRVDTTVVETNIHYPTDSCLLGDGVRVLTRAMKHIVKIAGRAGTALRDRTRAVGLQVRQIARCSRSRIPQGQERLKICYAKLLYHSARVLGQAKRFAAEVASGRKRARALLEQIALEGQRAYLERYLMTVDAAFFSQRNELAAQARGIKRVAVPNRSTKNPQRKRLEKKRWFRNAQRWRTGCEGRISLLKRRHGLNRCRYRGQPGIQRWVGLGVIADNLINLGHALAPPAER